MSRSYLNQKHYALSFQISHTFSPDGAAQAISNKMTFITGTLNRVPKKAFYMSLCLTIMKGSARLIIQVYHVAQ